MDVDKKIKKLCQKLEREFGPEIVCGERVKGNEVETVPVSVKKMADKDEHSSSYNQPIGLIEINGKKVRFIPLDKRWSALKTFLKILIVIIGVLGFKKFFKSKKTWNAE